MTDKSTQCPSPTTQKKIPVATVKPMRRDIHYKAVVSLPISRPTSSTPVPTIHDSNYFSTGRGIRPQVPAPTPQYVPIYQVPLQFTLPGAVSNNTFNPPSARAFSGAHYRPERRNRHAPLPPIERVERNPLDRT